MVSRLRDPQGVHRRPSGRDRTLRKGRAHHRNLGAGPVAADRQESAAALAKLRHVVEQTFAPLHQFKRLAVRRERRLELHDACGSWGGSLIWRRRFEKAGS
ncbi:hypothetical protein [Streptomyces rugosispiralis]|uniref:hypothetical protein n=1 Tax=Streptomyces rugosispiralis TaxID=2967341 RepID=UPI0037045539